MTLLDIAKNISELNESRCEDYTYEPYDNRTFIVSGILLPPLVLLGVVTNIINIQIFANRNMRKAVINWFLITLSILDLGIVMLSFCMLSLPVLADYCQSARMVELSNRCIKWTFPFALMAQTASVWLTVALTAYRFFGVCFPFKSRRLCTGNTVKLGVTLIFGLSIVYNLTRFLEMDLLQCWSDHFNESILLIVPTAFRGTYGYQTYYLGYSYTTVMFAVPFTCLIVMNSATIAAVRRSSASRVQMASASLKHSNQIKCAESINATKQERGTTLMLVAIVFCFLVCNFIPFISNIIEMILKNGRFHSDQLALAYSILVESGNLFVVLNSSMNLFVYYAFSKKYRQLVKQLFTLGQNRKNHTHEYTLQSTQYHQRASNTPTSVVQRRKPHSEELTDNNDNNNAQIHLNGYLKLSRGSIDETLDQSINLW